MSVDKFVLKTADHVFKREPALIVGRHRVEQHLVQHVTEFPSVVGNQVLSYVCIGLRVTEFSDRFDKLVRLFDRVGGQ